MSHGNELRFAGGALLSTHMTSHTYIITGAYGSGKTECALALALAWRAETAVTLVDLDFVNPYFRAQDHRALLAASGVQLIAPDKAVAANDAPAMPAAARDALVSPHGRTIVDLGGDPAGAVVIGQFAPQMTRYDLWAVMNFARPATAQGEGAALLAEISRVTRLRVSGLISNTYVGAGTDAADVLDGYARTEALARELGIPVVFACLPESLVSMSLPVPTLVIRRRLLRPWE